MTEESQVQDPVRVAVREGIQDALADPRTWDAVRSALTSYARTEAGGFTLGVLSTFFRWIFRVGLLVALVWSIGGLPAVIGFFKSGGHGSP